MTAGRDTTPVEPVVHTVWTTLWRVGTTGAPTGEREQEDSR